MTEQTNTTEKEDRPSRRRNQRSEASQEGGATEAKRPKPDTSGGIKIKLRGDEDSKGIVSRDDLVQSLMDAAQKVKSDFPSEAMFKWSTLYTTPCDADGNKVAVSGPRHSTITPYKSAADEHKM